jgi:hypothetical protein
MIAFEKFYNIRVVNESTRRSFLKQLMGTVAAAIGSPATATKALAAQPSKFSYDLTNAMSIDSIANYIVDFGNGSRLSEEALLKKAKKIHDEFAAGKINAKTIKQLIAYDNSWIDVLQTVEREALENFIEQNQQKLSPYMGDENNGLFLDALHGVLDDLSNTDALEELRQGFLAGDSHDVFKYIVPGDIKINGKVIMTQQQAIDKGIFETMNNVISATVEYVNETADYFMETNLDNKSVDDADEYADEYAIDDAGHQDIEYSPADYKGSWENDPDYQSLSMGESIVAEKSIHDPVRPGILKRQVKGKMTCSKARSLKSKQKNKGNNTAKAAQRYLNYHC